MKYFANNHDALSWILVRGLFLALVAGGLIALAFRNRDAMPPGVTPHEPGSRSKVSTKLPRPEMRSKSAELAGGTPDALLTATDDAPASRTVTEPGHEGHGDECAHCFAEKRLAACREDYAHLYFTQLTEAYVIDKSQSADLMRTCRRFAKAVLKDWSYSESRPLLPADEIVEARRREIVGPLLAGFPAKQADSP